VGSLSDAAGSVAKDLSIRQTVAVGVISVRRKNAERATERVPDFGPSPKQ